MAFYTNFPVYPTAILNTTDYPNQVDDTDYVLADLVNALRDEMIAVQAELGTLPKGGSASVKARLDAIGTPSIIQDADADTSVDCEESGDEDIIRMNAKGTEIFTGQDIGITLPVQPCFLVQPAGAQNNIPLSTATTVIFGTEVFDIGGNFASNTFTAPATGKYIFTVSVDFADIDSAASIYYIVLQTSNRTYTNRFSCQGFTADIATWTSKLSSVCDMDINDTAYVYVLQAGGTQQTDIQTPTSFSGAKIT